MKRRAPVPGKSFAISRRGAIAGAAAGLAGAAGIFALRRGAAQADPDGRLVVAINQMPPGVDYSRLDAAVNAGRPMLENITEQLVARDIAGNPVPGLATWTFLDGGNTIEFQLRKGVTFHNGMPFTAEDVVFSHERMMEYSALYRGRNRNFERTEILDPHTVRFYFSQPGTGFIRARLLFIFSKRYHDAVGEEQFGNQPIGTGPYKLVDFRRFEYADLDAFENFRDGAAPISRVRLAFVQEDMTRVAMLRSGEADMIMATPFPMVPTLERAGFLQAQAAVHPTFSVRFQLANPNTPWADLRVRKAIAHAIDARSIVDGLFGGVPTIYPSFTPTEIGYDPSIHRYSYDPALARRLLAEAGYADGFRMPMIYWANAYYGMRETTEAVALYLKAVGIVCEVGAIDQTQGLDLIRSMAKDTTARMTTIAPAIYANYSDPVEAMRQGYSGLSPYSWYSDEQFDAAVNGALAAYDDATQDRYLKIAARRLHEDLPLIPLWNNVVVYMMRPGIAFTPPNRDIPSIDLYRIRPAATT